MQEELLKAVIDGSEREYRAGTRLYEIADEYQPRYPHDIILASVNGKLSELHKKVKNGSEIHFVTTAEKPGMQAYQRSAVLMMLKAFHEVLGDGRSIKLTVDFSLGKGFFVEPDGDLAITGELLGKVKAKMEEYVRQKLPIMKRSVNTQEAVELFNRYGLHDKARLFSFRRVSRTNLYNLDGFDEYFYGYMAQNTGYIKYFDLIPYAHGFVLMLPAPEDPSRLPEFAPSRKLFEALKESSVWGKKMEIADVGALNQRICSGEATQLILIQEALQEKRIGQIAERIAEQPEKKFIMIAGPSSSGKTTFSYRLSVQLQALGLKPHPIAVDDYFVNRVNSPRDETGEYDYEALECLDIEQFNTDMNRLLAGETVEMPQYNFISGEREYKGKYLTLGRDDILVIEGIHCLNDHFSCYLPKESKFKIYVSALTQLNIDEHNRIPTTDGRLLRRMVRDARTRGVSARDTIARWPSVRRGEEKNIFPFQDEADVMFNSASVYELSVLKLYAEPLLFRIPGDCPEYGEAKRLLKFLDYFLGMDSKTIPINSIVREFIGGSCFPV